MKTKEFIEKMAEVSWHLVDKDDFRMTFSDKSDDDESVLTVGLKANYIRLSESYIFATAKVMQFVLDHLNTPVEDREDEKKYNIVFWDARSIGCPFYALRKRGADQAYMDNATQPLDLQKEDYQYTKSEIDALCEDNPEFSGVIRAAMREVKE